MANRGACELGGATGFGVAVPAWAVLDAKVDGQAGRKENSRVGRSFPDA